MVVTLVESFVKYSLVCALLACCLLANAEDAADLTKREVDRRGSMVETIGDFQDLSEAAICEALALPADNNHKFCISVISTKGCKWCDLLKNDFATSPHLKAYVDVDNYDASWANYHEFYAEDQSQGWRFYDLAELKNRKFPILVIQPPLDGSYGHPMTKIRAIVGYSGNPKALAATLQHTIKVYVATHAQKRSSELATQQRRMPFDLPQGTEGEDSSPFDRPEDTKIGEAMSLIALLASTATALIALLVPGGMTTVIVAIAIMVVVLIQKYRKSMGLKLWIPESVVNALAEKIKDKMFADESVPANVQS